MRLIDADALKAKLPIKEYGDNFILRKFMHILIDEQPTIENRPHGEWLSHYDYCKKHGLIPSGLIAFWWCNQCEQGVEIKTNFCPNCGARMEAEGER